MASSSATVGCHEELLNVSSGPLQSASLCVVEAQADTSSNSKSAAIFTLFWFL
jgi:hypothetical protein